MELPIDILGEIFKVCTREEQLYRSERAAKCETCKPPSIGRILSQVNQHWRIAAHSTPSMWRFVHIDLKSRHQMSGRRPPPKMMEWAIERSGACPLELSFSNLGSDDALELVEGLVSRGSDVGQRIERLEIGLAGASYLPFLSILENADTSNLKELVLYHTGYFTVHETIPDEALHTLEHTNIHTLTLGRIQWMSESFVYFNITSLTVDLGHKHEALLMRTLASFPNITELTLQCTDYVKLTDSWEPIPEVSLPHLRHITFDPRICTYSLYKLKAPMLNTITARHFTRLSPRFLAELPCTFSLSTLRLESFHPEFGYVMETSNRAAYKSLDSLKSEWTSSFTPGRAGFINCLLNHGEIVTLELDNCSISDEYLSFLTEEGSMPNLTNLRLSNCPNVSRTLLDELISYRRSHCSNPSDFTVEYTR